MEEDTVSSTLVTGPWDRSADIAMAFKTAGVDVITAGTDLADVAAHDGKVDCYVQLPFPPVDHDALTSSRGILARNLLVCFDTIAQVAPLLAPTGRVLLVVDTVTAPDLRLLRILVQAILADHGRDHVRITVIDHAHPPEDLVAAALIHRWLSPHNGPIRLTMIAIELEILRPDPEPCFGSTIQFGTFGPSRSWNDTPQWDTTIPDSENRSPWCM